MDDKLRIAIVNADKCKPKKCKQECKKCCPINKSGKLCIEVLPTSKIAFISEALCIGCGLCVKKCPFEAIKIINLPTNLSKLTTHRYGANTFKLHRLPTPRAGQVLGLVGSNGTGKSTALQILANKIKPNLGNFENPPDWADIIKYFRGSELQNFFTKLLEDELKATIKPQYVDSIPKFVKGKLKDIIEKKDERKVSPALLKELDLSHLVERDIEVLSGGELQRMAIMIVAMQNKAIYMFDEPSSYLDVKQRLRAAECIRGLLKSENYVIVVEHDLSILDYLSDFVCCLYGEPGAYGVVTMPFTVREGINIFLAGFVPTENLRFREIELTFKVVDTLEQDIGSSNQYKYPKMEKVLGDFHLTIEAGNFTNSQIVIMLGENGTGKTTFIRMLAGQDQEKKGEVPELNVSYKPQKIAPKFEGTVTELLMSKLKGMFSDPQFISDVIRPLQIDYVKDNEVKTLSGGELQRVALVLALGKPADVYLIDEPSAYLDSEQRIIASKVLKRFILNSKKAGFIVEHDFIMATYLADLVIVYEGTPGRECVAHSPQTLVSGMNKFLCLMGITFRRDPTNFRPRINKLESQKDKEQKLSGNHFVLEE
jgi:ATP-binding cassette subfamily E protein 1